MCEAWRRDVDDGDDHDNVVMAGKVMVSVIMMIMMTAVLERYISTSKIKAGREQFDHDDDHES